jgi:hypothetical protein
VPACEYCVSVLHTSPTDVIHTAAGPDNLEIAFPFYSLIMAIFSLPPYRKVESCPSILTRGPSKPFPPSFLPSFLPSMKAATVRQEAAAACYLPAALLLLSQTSSGASQVYRELVLYIIAVAPVTARSAAGATLFRLQIACSNLVVNLSHGHRWQWAELSRLTGPGKHRKDTCDYLRRCWT